MNDSVLDFPSDNAYSLTEDERSKLRLFAPIVFPVAPTKKSAVGTLWSAAYAAKQAGVELEQALATFELLWKEEEK